jgi:hypothetical protein
MFSPISGCGEVPIPFTGIAINVRFMSVFLADKVLRYRAPASLRFFRFRHPTAGRNGSPHSLPFTASPVYQKNAVVPQLFREGEPVIN